MGLGEIILILVVIVLFVRPEDLPKFFRTVGRIYGELQHYSSKLRYYAHANVLELEKRKSDETTHAGDSEVLPRQTDPGTGKDDSTDTGS